MEQRGIILQHSMGLTGIARWLVCCSEHLMCVVTTLQLPDWITSVKQNFGPDYNNLWLSPLPANDSRALQVRRDVLFKPNPSSHINIFLY